MSILTIHHWLRCIELNSNEWRSSSWGRILRSLITNNSQTKLNSNLTLKTLDSINLRWTRILTCYRSWRVSDARKRNCRLRSSSCKNSNVQPWKNTLKLRARTSSRSCSDHQWSRSRTSWRRILATIESRCRRDRCGKKMLAPFWMSIKLKCDHSSKSSWSSSQ